MLIHLAEVLKARDSRQVAQKDQHEWLAAKLRQTNRCAVGALEDTIRGLVADV
jgi:hypothetical protein